MSIIIFNFKLEDCFHDYDPLRTGYVSASDFNKALKEVFEELLTDEQVEEIQNQYCVHSSPDCFNWSKFLHDAETGKILSLLSLINHLIINANNSGKNLHVNRVEYHSLIKCSILVFLAFSFLGSEKRATGSGKISAISKQKRQKTYFG